MKIAFVYDRINTFGGAERVLLALHEIWPEAPIYTSVVNYDKTPWSHVFPEIIPSFLQKFPFAKDHHEFYPFLMPIAFESFTFDKYDVVLSITSEAGKGIITKPHTLHICYCLTPTRYLWSNYSFYKDTIDIGIATPLAKFLFIAIAKRLRRWDKIASQRPDVYFSISQNVEKRIKKYYNCNAKVIYPPVDTNKFALSTKKKQNYFLIVSRLVSYKRIDIAIAAFNRLGWPLIIVGSGRQSNSLKKMAKENISFVDSLTDEHLVAYYQRCKALIFPGEEDFGITPLEAQATGTPVIAFRGGGVLETVKEGESGEFFDHLTVDSLIKALLKFDKKHYNKEAIRKNILSFSKNNFKKSFKSLVEVIYHRYQNKI